eukprot:14011-Heterococcus_DN1.PRE.4
MMQHLLHRDYRCHKQEFFKSCTARCTVVGSQQQRVNSWSLRGAVYLHACVLLMPLLATCEKWLSNLDHKAQLHNLLPNLPYCHGALAYHSQCCRCVALPHTST